MLLRGSDMKKILSRFVVVALASVVAGSHASALTESVWRVGLLAGQIGLLDNVGQRDPNSVGYGLTAGYLITDDLVFESSYVRSSHDDVSHHEVSFGANYYVGDYVAAYPNLAAGVTFIRNRLTDIAISADGVGFYFGGGWDFEITPVVLTGIQARYLATVESKTNVRGREFSTVDDSFSVLLRFIYRFDPSAE